MKSVFQLKSFPTMFFVEIDSSSPLDFIVATPMGIQDGLRRGGSVLLEPILEIRFTAPDTCYGRIGSDVAA